MASPEHAVTTLTRTVEPLKIDLNSSSKAPDESGGERSLEGRDGTIYEVGSIALEPHTLLSSRRHFWEALPEGSRTSRAYFGLSKEHERTT